MKHWTRCGYNKIVACKNTLHGAKHMVVGTGMAASWFQFKSIFLPCRFERASNKDTEYPYTLVPLFCLVTQQNLSLKKNCFVGTQKNIDIKRPTLWSAWFSFVWGKTVLKKWAHESFCTHWSDRGTRDAMKLDNCSKSAASSRIAGVSCQDSRCQLWWLLCGGPNPRKQPKCKNQKEFEMSVWYDVKCQGEQMFTKEHVPPWGD